MAKIVICRIPHRGITTRIQIANTSWEFPQKAHTFIVDEEDFPHIMKNGNFKLLGLCKFYHPSFVLVERNGPLLKEG